MKRLRRRKGPKPVITRKMYAVLFKNNSDGRGWRIWSTYVSKADAVKELRAIRGRSGAEYELGSMETCVYPEKETPQEEENEIAKNTGRS